MRPSAPAAPTFVEQARRQQMVEGTIAVLADRGHAATSLAAVAAELGISKGLVHYHFRDKDELLRQVIVSVWTERGQHVAARVASTGSPSEAVAAYIVGHLEYLDGHRNEVSALHEVLAGLPPGDPGVLAAQAESLDALAGLVASGQRKKEFHSGSARLTALWILSVIDAFPAYLQAEPNVNIPRAATELCDMVLRSLTL